MTLKFVRQQGLVRGCGGEEEREGGGGERAGKRPRTSLHPVPRFVSSKEIEVMENSLHRWIGELTQDVDGKLCSLIAICRRSGNSGVRYFCH